MNFKEKMMDGMMGKMTAEDKKDMMDKMMDNFFSSMTKEEKQDMMNNMMPKMMEQMMGGDNKSSGDNSMMKMMSSMMGGSNSMMGMMESMMGTHNKAETDSNPMDMCKEMMSKISHSSEIATYATPEVRQLFEEWVQQVDDEILQMIQTNSSISPEKIAESLKITKDSVLYFLTRLAQKGKISLQVGKVQA